MIEETTATHKYRMRFKQLQEEANSWLPHWKEIVEYMMPRQGRYLSGNKGEDNKGDKKNQKIINGSANDALRVIAAGMQGGLTSPSRPWFVLSLPDEDLMEYAPVREWLHTIRNAMLNVFSRSNFYGSIHGLYKELAGPGTAAMIIEEDFRTVIRTRPFTIGEFYLALDSKYRPEALYRQFTLSARQLVEKFGEEAVTEAVRSSLKNNSGERRFEVAHIIEPNKETDIRKGDARGMEYVSVYYELNADKDKVLSKSGYKSIPFVAPRWEVTGVDVYGSSPAMNALGDVKMLQKMEDKKLKALDKMVDPPMNAPTSMKKKGGTIISGGVNYIDVQQGQQSFSPAYMVNPDIQNIAFEIDRVEQRIKRFFFNDLFLSLIGTDKTMTATEVSERHSEKLLMLGPVLERLQAELLDPIIERTYSIMDDLGMLPPPPKEMEGMEVKIEYISLLAQAQKMVGTTGIEQTAAFVGNLTAVSPDVADKFDADEAVDQYADMLGIPPKVIRSDDKVAEIRAARAEAQRQQDQQMQAAGAIESAKKLSETKMNQDSALDGMMEGL